MDVGPVYPASVADYLRKTKAANKLNVTFDYDTELFIAVDDGEFVLVSNSREDTKPIVLPRSARFASKRDFYELYQDYYHCTNLDAGEVHIIEPAFVEPIREGWKLQSTGTLEVVEDPPNTKAPANMTLSERETSVRPKPEPSITAATEESPAAPCPNCGSLIDTIYAFCWKCGIPLTPDGDDPKKPTEAIVQSLPINMEDEEATLPHDTGLIQPSVFSWALPTPSGQVTSTTGSMLKLFAIGAVGLVLVSLGLFVLTRSSSQMDLSTETQRAPSNLQSHRNSLNVNVATNVTADPTAQVSPIAHSEEDELRKLREKRIGTADSDRSTILVAFARTEKQYPNDYRFPYERAKLAIKRHETKSHEDAFSALSLAAERAIRTDKAQEMLEGLEADKAGDFRKLAHGHREWTQVVEALKSKDPTLLTANPQF